MHRYWTTVYTQFVGLFYILWAFYIATCIQNETLLDTCLHTHRRTSSVTTACPGGPRASKNSCTLRAHCSPPTSALPLASAPPCRSHTDTRHSSGDGTKNKPKRPIGAPDTKGTKISKVIALVYLRYSKSRAIEDFRAGLGLGTLS